MDLGYDMTRKTPKSQIFQGVPCTSTNQNELNKVVPVVLTWYYYCGNFYKHHPQIKPSCIKSTGCSFFTSTGKWKFNCAYFLRDTHDLWCLSQSSEAQQLDIHFQRQRKTTVDIAKSCNYVSLPGVNQNPKWFCFVFLHLGNLLCLADLSRNTHNLFNSSVLRNALPNTASSGASFWHRSSPPEFNFLVVPQCAVEYATDFEPNTYLLEPWNKNCTVYVQLCTHTHTYIYIYYI